MKKDILLLCFILVLLISFISCSSNNSKASFKTTCPIFIGPPGSQWWSMPDVNKINSKDNLILTAVEKYEGGSPSFFESNGCLYQITEENGVKNAAVEIGKKAFVTAETYGGERIITMFKGMGKDEKWTGIPGGRGEIYHLIEKGKTKQIAIKQFKKVTIDKAQRIFTVYKGMRNNDRWTFDCDGKVYQITGDGKTQQVGWCAYHWITPKNGQRLKTVILMSKGMQKNAKWCGEKDSILYLEE